MKCQTFNATGTYGPFGVNDNNFNRQIFPSNNFVKNGDHSGEITNHFNPLTTTTNNYSDFDKAFPDNIQPIIEKIDYTNKNNLIHNNIGSNVLDEHVIEYRVMIDSIDRDIKTYPNPFSYVVKFNPASSSTGLDSSGNFVRYDGSPYPHIGKQFNNVKYIKLENVILPQYSNIKYKDGEFVHDPNSIIVTNMYNSLVIEELSNERIYTTSQTNPNPFALIIPDKIIGTTFYSGTPYYGSKIYKNSLLGNITQLHIQFTDCNGVPLKVDNLYSYDDMQQYEYDNGVPFPVDDMRNPYNKKLQNHISLIFGVIECQINTNTKFDQ
jgi:hypothetical protein